MDEYPLIWRPARCVVLQDISQALKVPDSIGVQLSVIVALKTVSSLKAAIDSHGYLHVRVVNEYGDDPNELTYNGTFFVTWEPVPF